MNFKYKGTGLAHIEVNMGHPKSTKDRSPDEAPAEVKPDVIEQVFEITQAMIDEIE